MDNFFIADKLRGIPLVTGSGRQTAYDKDTHESKQSDGNQLEKRDVASSSSFPSSSSDSGILFKSGAITASTSNLRKQTNKPTTATKWVTTTKRPTTTTTTIRPTKKNLRKQLTSPSIPATAAAATTTTTTTTTTRKPHTTSGQPSKQVSSTSQVVQVTTESMSASIRPTVSANRNEEENIPKTTMKKFDKLIQYHQNDRQTPEVPAYDIVNPTHQTSRTSTTAQLPLITQPVNQRRTLQPVLGPQRFNDNGRSASAGENWIFFNRHDGGYSFFETLVLFSSIIMIGVVVLVIISNWMRSFKRKRQKALSPMNGTPAPRGDTNQQPDVGSRSPSMNMQTTESSGDGTRKISMISSGMTSLGTSATANTITDVSSVVSTANNSPKGPEAGATVIDMMANQSIAPVTSAAEVMGTAGEAGTKLTESIQQQVIGAAQNISSEIKQATGNLSNKAMAIVQPTENNATSSLVGKSRSATGAPDNLSVMSDPLADHKMSAEFDRMNKKQSSALEKNINGSTDHISASSPMIKPDQPSSNDKGAVLLEELFNSTASNRATAALSEMKSSPGKKTDFSRIGSLESIELPTTLIESIKRADAGKVSAPEEAPSPNLLLGEKELDKEKPTTESDDKKQPKSTVVEKGSVSKADTKGASKKVTSSQSSDSLRRTEQQQQRKAINSGKRAVQRNKAQDEQRPGNPMGRDNCVEGQATKETPGSTANAAIATAEVKNHQVVVNKLDKRKTNLEIVDLRDESVTGKMRSKEESKGDSSTSGNWISMDGVAVVGQPSGLPAAGQPSSVSNQPAQVSAEQQQHLEQQTVVLMSPSEIIESRFHVDYKGKRRAQMGDKTGSKDSTDSKATDYLTNNIESELEQDNKMRNRKYFVYVVHDGHFTAKKECIARIELPPKRRITLAEMRHLIANSQDISLTSLRRNKFKFVTETYRLLNENEDATILHQVYPTQGVFLKLNIPEQENQAYAFKGARSGPTAGRLSTGSATAGSSLSNTTIASRRRAGVKQNGLPAIEVDGYALGERGARAASVGRRNRQPAPGGSYRRSKSSLVQAGRQQQLSQMTTSHERLPSIGRSRQELEKSKRGTAPKVVARRLPGPQKHQKAGSLGEAATDLGQNVLSGAKKLFNSTFKR